MKIKRFNENNNFNNEFSVDTTEYLSCLDCLKKVTNINRQEVIAWFNEVDIDYFNMSDIEMMIIYIEKNAL